MTMLVTIQNGIYRGEAVQNQTFELVSDIKDGAKGTFITVRPNDTIGGDRDKIRVTVLAADVIYDGVERACMLENTVQETDEEIMARIADRFAVLEEITDAAAEGAIRAVIVSGPPGVGKSYGVAERLKRANLFTAIQNKPPRYDIVKGSVTPIVLYTMLYYYRNVGEVLVFDDCDSILHDEATLNMLKAALDSGKSRRITWNRRSSFLRDEGIPDHFDFKGSIIFISNLKFDKVQSKNLQLHLAALQSRCHYLDLAMNSEHDRMLRIRQVHQSGELFSDYDFTNNEGDTVIEYMFANKDRLRELSLRMAVKLADLIKISPSNWQRLAASTVMKHL